MKMSLQATPPRPRLFRSRSPDPPNDSTAFTTVGRACPAPQAETGGSMELHRHGGEDRVRRVIGKVAAARFVVEQKAVLQAGRHVLEQSLANAGLEPVPLVIDAQRQALGFIVLGVISVGGRIGGLEIGLLV